jgi:hypothetical protein
MAIAIEIIIPAVSIELKAKAIRRALGAAGRLLAATARGLIESSPGGAGNPPKNRTGALASSIRSSARKSYVKIVASDGGSTALEVGAVSGGGDTHNQANILFAHEIDARGNIKRGANRLKKSAINKNRKMAARPFMNPALESKRDEIQARLQQAIMGDIEFKLTNWRKNMGP